jgi:glycosyltransferase involved in cell wall biosynthesis
MSDLVSVIIPAYNQGNFLSRSIQSVLDQSYTQFEIIVVDDGSTDNTYDIVKNFVDPRIGYIYQDNKGLSGARNTGYVISTGDYLTYLDSDDLFTPTKLALQVSFLETHLEYGCVSGQILIIDENDKSIGRMFDGRPPEKPENFLLGNPLSVHSVLTRRVWQDKAGKFDESLRSYEDWDMWLRLARLGCKFGWVDAPVSLYRFHSAQMTRIGSQMTQATFAVLDKVYSDPDLPPSWQVLKDQAYGNANLRAMAQAYLAEDFLQGKAYLSQAIQLNPKLVDGQAIELTNRLSALADSPKTNNPVNFLASIYANLPDELDSLRQRAPEELSKKALSVAMDAYRHQDYRIARSYLHQALKYQPTWLIKREVLAALLGTYTHTLINSFR